MSTIVGTDIFLIARGTTNYQVTAADVAAYTGGGGAGVASFSAGTTGFTPVAATTGAVTLAGILNIANGGTGATTSAAALTNLLPAQAGNAGKVLVTNGTNASWGAPSGSNVQAAAAAPATRSDGTALQAGDIYYNTTDRTLYTWNGTAWVPEVSGSINIQTAAAAPATRSNGLALVEGDLYYNTTSNTMFSWDGLAWQGGGSVVAATLAEAAAATLTTVYLSPGTGIARDAAGTTGAALLPAGTSAQKPVTPVMGMTRYNSTIETLEVYTGTKWIALTTAGGVEDPLGWFGHSATPS